MRIKRSAYVLLVVTLPSLLAAQETTNTQKEATKLEAFQAKTGIVVVRGYTTVGMIRGLGADITIDAREFRDATSASARASGITVSVKENGGLERENTSFIDADEIDSLLAGLDYISRASKEMTKLSQFEAEYRTKGNFSVAVFSQSNGPTSTAVSSGLIGKTTAYIRLSDLPELRRLIVAAKAQL